jgi:hypothetical protein
VFGGEEQLTTKKILAELCLIEDAPWNDLKGKPITDNQLARRLRQYGVKSRNIRVGDAVPKGYMRADLDDVWRRYLPPLADKAATAATPATAECFQGDGVAARAATEPLHTDAEPLRDDADVASVAADEEACSASDDVRNADEMGTVAPVAAVAPLPGNGGEPGLGAERHHQLAEWRGRWLAEGEDPNDLDDALRATIREEVADLSLVEAELEQVKRLMRKGNGTGSVSRTASVPFMLTHELKKRLRICGYSEAEITAMTPQQAHAILAQAGWSP